MSLSGKGKYIFSKKERESFRKNKKIVMVKGLKLPVIYQSGVITDNQGKTILKANRETGTTPLSPSERDELMKIVTYLINNYNFGV
jgi:hypothetical protein